MPATEIKATALEAMGDDRQASDAYLRRIEQLARTMSPDFAEWQVQVMRDWWVGHAYAQCVTKSGQARAIEKSLREQISRPAGLGTNAGGQRMPRILLAYLLEAQGKDALALAEWRSMVTVPAQQAAADSPEQPAVATKNGI